MFQNFIKQRMAGYLRQAELFGEMRSIWQNHVWQDREATIAIINNLPSTQSSVDFALTTPVILGDLYSRYYSDRSAKKIEDTFAQHIKIAGSIVTAATAHDQAQLETLTKQWYQNADEFAKVLASLNPHYNEDEIRKMMYEHLRLILLMVSQIVNGKYSEGVNTFKQILKEAQEMADYLSKGLIAQFPDKFR